MLTRDTHPWSWQCCIWGLQILPYHKVGASETDVVKKQNTFSVFDNWDLY